MTNTYILNKTPIRTSKNYHINDLTMENLYLPSARKDFQNVVLSHENVNIMQDMEFEKLSYGTGEILEENMKNNCNSFYSISSNGKDGKFVINYVFDDNNKELSNYLNIEANEDMAVIITFKSNTNEACFHNFILKTKVSHEAKLHIEIVNLLNDQTNHFISVENEIDHNSEAKVILVDMGAKNSISNIYSNLIGANANSIVKSIYIGQGDVVKDMNYIAHLRGKESIADMDLQGVLSDRSRKALKFTIDFKTGCTGAKGSENESCMLLSDDAKYISMPVLLCTEDDVEGAHSAAAGQVDPGQLFYIMSRGFEKKEAVKMLVKAKYNEIIEELQDEDIKKEILAVVDKRIG